MKKQTIILSTFVSFWLFSTGHALAATLTGTITYDGTSSGSAMAGTERDKKGAEKKDSKGNTIPTTKKNLKRDDKHAKNYDGATQFDAIYSICFDDQGNLDLAKSTVIFDVKNYTDKGILVTDDPFKSLPIKVTSVTFMNGDPSMGLESFMFESKKWYGKGRGYKSLVENGLSGMINLKTNQSSYLASYIWKSTGSIYKYNVTGTVKAPQPGPEPEPKDLGQPPVFSPRPIPEANSVLSLFALGTLGIRSTLKPKVKLSANRQ